MMITFDLDDTLICHSSTVPSEETKRPWHLCWYKPEPLRKGSIKLFNRLRKDGWKIGIYTTSFRTASQVRKFLRCYGLTYDSFVNQNDHLRLLKDLGIDQSPSKLPNHFGSILHVDDSEGVRLEGDKYGYRVLIVDPSDEQWCERVLAESEKVDKQ